jgi:hypothetical protein
VTLPAERVDAWSTMLRDRGKTWGDVRSAIQEALGENAPDISGEPTTWPNGLAGGIQKWIERFAVLARAGTPVPSGAPATSAAPAGPTERKPWPVPARTTPAHPAYWRAKLLALATEAVKGAAADSPLRSVSAGELVDNLEVLQKLPAPGDVPDADAAAKYREAHAEASAQGFDWAKFTIPF